MEKIICIFLSFALVLSLAACSSKSVMSTETISVDSVCVDDDYRDSDNSSLRLVYVFMTIGPVKENLQVSSQYVKMRIGESNVYSSQLYPVNKYADNYYYSRYLEDVYISEQLKFVATFAVPEGDLTGGKNIVLMDDHFSAEAEKIHFTTDDIQHYNGDTAITQAVDPEGYAHAMAQREPADAATASTVKDYITQYTFRLYANGISYALSFNGSNFTLKTNLGSNSGTYVIQKGYLACTYSSNGYTLEIPYSVEDGKIDLDTSAAFSF